MKTFEMTFGGLGPITSANLTTSLFTVLCGKNNTGKSFCMHTFFCFLSKWRREIKQVVREDQLRAFVEKKSVDIHIDDYIRKINDWIKASIPSFIQAIPALLKKNSLKADGIQFDLQIDEGYAREVLYNANYKVTIRISQDCEIVGAKSVGDIINVRMINKGERFPSDDEIREAFNQAIWYLFIHRVLPRPILLTAERSGMVLYGDDVRNYSFSLVQAISGDSSEGDDGILSKDPSKYAYPYAEELRGYWNLKAQGIDSAEEERESDPLICSFSRLIDGRYQIKNGNIFYRQNGSDRNLLVDEVSTSIRATTPLNYFLKAIHGINPMLMIDEPELNLHPEKQRAFARFLAELVNQEQICVMITTHSDCIIRELNTLIALGSDKKQYGAIAAKHGYSDTELLTSGSVACGVVGGGSIKQMPVVDHGGMFIESFDETYELISAIQREIAMSTISES